MRACALGGQVAAAMRPPEAAGAKEFEVLKLAALLVASAAAFATSGATATTSATPSADSGDTLVSSAAWWERVTVTLDGDGTPEACRYETSVSPAKAETCDVDSGQAAMARHASASKGEVTRITFERRFSPGEAPPKANLQVGDTLLGGQIMSLAIDQHGAVKGCEIVAASGAMRPQYGCADAQAEKFTASVSTQPQKRQGYMTILVYGHSEHMV